MKNEILKNKTLFIVDDSKVTLAVFSDLLKDKGCTVITCHSPALAMNMINENNVDCIISGLEMPEMNGRDFCKLIKQDKNLKEIPFVMLTSRQKDGDIIECIDLGADDYLFKTASTGVILAKIIAMLRLKAMRDEIIQLRQLSAVQGIIVTLSHEFNNVVFICNIQLTRVEKLLNKIPKDFSDELKHINKLTTGLTRLTDLISKVKTIKEYKEDTYADNTSMVNIDSEEKD
jgi:DNA-binding response OmpR family regulator